MLLKLQWQFVLTPVNLAPFFQAFKEYEAQCALLLQWVGEVCVQIQQSEEGVEVLKVNFHT